MTKRKLVAWLFLLPPLACADLTAPVSREGPPKAADEAEPPQPAALASARRLLPAQRPPQPPGQPPQGQAAGDQETIAASHILISYKGAMRAKPDVTRSKEEAAKKAQNLARLAKAGEDFAKLAEKESDDASAARGGQLGRFQRGRMVKPFSDTAFSLKPGEVSGVVETPFGYHIIRRTE
jgi:hypothetical protein